MEDVMFWRRVAIVLLPMVMMLPAPEASSQNVDCRDTIKTHGFLTRAQFQCGFKFYNQEMIDAAAACAKRFSPNRTKEMLRSGFATFDNNEKGKGRKYLCEQVLKKFPSVVRNDPPGQPRPAARLPFPDGTYAKKPSDCETASGAPGDYVLIDGSEVSIWESGCEVRAVRRGGNQLTVSASCATEGLKPTMETLRLTMVSPTSFKFSNERSVFSLCKSRPQGPRVSETNKDRVDRNCIISGDIVTGEVRFVKTKHPNGMPLEVYQLFNAEGYCVLDQHCDRSQVSKVFHISNPRGRRELERSVGQIRSIRTTELFCAHTAWHIGDAVIADGHLIAEASVPAQVPNKSSPAKLEWKSTDFPRVTMSYLHRLYNRDFVRTNDRNIDWGDPPFDVAEVYLGDRANGNPDLIVQWKGYGWCGSGGCQTHVWMFNNKDYEQVFEGLGFGEIELGPERTLGFLDLWVDHTRYRWTGKSYEPR